MVAWTSNTRLGHWTMDFFEILIEMDMKYGVVVQNSAQI